MIMLIISIMITVACFLTGGMAGNYIVDKFKEIL